MEVHCCLFVGAKGKVETIDVDLEEEEEEEEVKQPKKLQKPTKTKTAAPVRKGKMNQNLRHLCRKLFVTMCLIRLSHLLVQQVISEFWVMKMRKMRKKKRKR